MKTGLADLKFFDAHHFLRRVGSIKHKKVFFYSSRINYKNMVAPSEEIKKLKKKKEIMEEDLKPPHVIVLF